MSPQTFSSVLFTLLHSAIYVSHIPHCLIFLRNTCHHLIYCIFYLPCFSFFSIEYKLLESRIVFLLIACIPDPRLVPDNNRPLVIFIEWMSISNILGVVFFLSEYKRGMTSSLEHWIVQMLSKVMIYRQTLSFITFPFFNNVKTLSTFKRMFNI